MITSYRITKYNPQKRDAQGAYLDRLEWTAISDIGKPEANSPTGEEYDSVENAYVNAVKAVLNDTKLSELKVSGFELHHTNSDFKKFELDGRLRNLSVDFRTEVKVLKDGMVLRNSQLEKVVRLILREIVWMDLRNDEVEVKFGYDYYMYIKCHPLQPETIAQIEKTGLYVEPSVAQLSYKIVDSQGNEIL
jgi:hypothetical protein